MKWIVRSLPLLALLVAACTNTTNTTVVTSTITPTITEFSADTVWTFRSLRIYGTHFGYDPLNVRVMMDSVLLPVDSVEDTVAVVTIPEAAKTGLVHLWAYEETAVSARPLVVEYTFNPHTAYDSVSIGQSFSIPGTGMNNYHGILRIALNGRPLPVDSVFADRIVSHVVPGTWSGTLSMSDSDGAYYPGSLTVTRGSIWRTLSVIFDNLRISEYHVRTGYVNGPGHPIDSTWYTTATYSGQADTSIAGALFAVSSPPWLVYSLARKNNGNYPLLQISWDTVNERADVTFDKYSSVPSGTGTDTLWYDNGEYVNAPLPVDRDAEFPLTSIRYQIQRDSSDGQGLVNWQETVSGAIISGSFDLILKQ